MSLIRKEPPMPATKISSPVGSAPVDRLSLGTDWVRPSATGIPQNNICMSNVPCYGCFADEA
jgi:hypothetical protein